MSKDERIMQCPHCGAENYSWRSRCQTCDALLHEEDNNINIVNFHSWDPLKLTASISGVIGAVVLVLFTLFIMAFASGRITDLLAWLVVTLTGIFALVCVVIAWKWRLVGGILLIVIGLVPMGLIIWSILQTHSVWSFTIVFALVPGIPSIASGAIFLFLRRER